MQVTTQAQRYRHTVGTFKNIPVFKKPDAAKANGNRIRQLILDVNMVNRVAGLTEIAKKRGVDTDSLKAGDFVVFMNASWTQMALLTGSPGAGVLPTVTYVKSPRGKIHPGVIRELTRIFNGSPLSYDKALEPVLKKFMLDRKIKKTGDARG